jgi:predicted RNA-binding protein YlxR (DUF448 family)
VEFVKKVTRTCVHCRGKFDQKKLLRLQCKEKQLDLFTGVGRSFYLCEQCCSQDINKLSKTIFRQCKNKAEYESQLKEMIEVWMIK